MVDYAKSAVKATTTLTKFGQSITRTAYTAGTYTDGAITSTSAATTRVGAVFDFSAGKTTIRNSLIEVGDKQILLDATASVAMTDTYTVGSVVYRVVSISEINPAGTCVLYDLHVRRA